MIDPRDIGDDVVLVILLSSFFGAILLAAYIIDVYKKYNQ